MNHYKNLGDLLRAYRKFHSLSQENLSEKLDTSLKSYQRWERNEHPINQENLIKIASTTMLPTHIFKSLNAGIPLYCSIRKRNWALTKIEAQSYFYHEHLSTNPPDDEGISIQFLSLTNRTLAEEVKKSDQINLPSDNAFKIDTAVRAAEIIPDMNFIVYDEFNLPVGHQVCFPLSPSTFARIKRGEIAEGDLSPDDLIDVPKIGIGAFFCTAEWASCRSVQHNIMTKLMYYFSQFADNERLILGGQVTVIEGHEIARKIGLTPVFKNLREKPVTEADGPPTIYEGNIKNILAGLPQNNPETI